MDRFTVRPRRAAEEGLSEVFIAPEDSAAAEGLARGEGLSGVGGAQGEEDIGNSKIWGSLPSGREL
jgi:hypothetical protein